jgi:hypothetical protein
MLVLTTILLLLSGIALGLARRSWWEIGALTLLTWGCLQLADTWIGSWRDQVGLPHDQRFFELRSIGWLLLSVYASYALAFLYSRWRLPAGTQSNH